MIGSFDDERDFKYIPPGTQTPFSVARTSRSMPMRVASSVVTTSQSNEERTLTGTPSGSAAVCEVSSGSAEAFGSEEDSSLQGDTTPSTSVHSASS